MPDTAQAAARYAIVGTGARHAMFSRALSETFAATSELAGLCDCNPVRLAVAAGEVAWQAGNGIATYGADEFERMIAEQRPETVVVTVPDALHHDYIIRAMEAGCDVITEKPMTTDLGRLRAILDARERTGRKVTVTFNYRYTPARTQLKDILMSGAIGRVRRSTSAGTSTGCTAPTISGAGTATERTRAGCWCTSRRIISTS